MERTSKLERALFKAVRILMLIAALLALLAAIGLGVNGFIKSNASADEKIKAPELSFEAYSDRLAKEKAARDNAREQEARDRAAAGEGKISSGKKATEKTEPEQFPAQYRDVLNEIEKSVANYARKTGQPAPTETLRGNLFLEASSRFSSYGLVDDFFGKLARMSKSLEAAGDSMNALEDSDPGKIFWGKFLDYVYDSYQGDLNRQTTAINKALYEAKTTRMLAPADYMKAGICLGAFFVLVLLLVLLNIEKNTYAASMVLRSAYPGAYTESEPLITRRPPAAPQSRNTGGTGA